MRQLFRQEAIDAQREKLLGAVSSARPVPLRVFSAIAAAFAVALIVFAFWGEYTRRERVEGFLATDAGAARVLAPMAGVVQELLVKEGIEVKPGTPIARLMIAGQVGSSDPKELELQAQQLESEIADAKRLAKQEEDQVRGRVKGFEAELEQSSAEIELQKSRVGQAQAELDRTQKLVDEGFYSASELVKKRSELLEQQSKLQALRRARAGVERELANARAETGAVQIKLSEKLSQLQRKLSELRSQGKIASQTIEIKASTAGILSNIAVAKGESVAGDSPIATIVPPGSLRAQLLLPTRASGFIRPGNEVILRYDAFPFQRFGQYKGTVDDVSRTVWSTGERVGQMTAREPVYRVDVKLERQTVMAAGQETPLRQGMVVSADILLEKRTVFEWVFEPVLELRGRLQ